MAIRLAAITASLTRAIDLCFGQPDDHVERTTLLAADLAGAVGLSQAVRSQVYWLGQLRFLGCTGHAHEVAVIFGNEIAARADGMTLDFGSPQAVLGWMIRNAGGDRAWVPRLQSLSRALATGRRAAVESFRGGCEVGRELVARLGLDHSIAEALNFSFERWDGKGMPWGWAGEAIPMPMLVVHVAQELEVFARGGAAAAKEAAQQRSGSAYAPAIAAAFLADADGMLERLDKQSGWDALLAAEPEPHLTVADSQLDEVLTVVADFADLKSPYTVGHSRGVAELAERAAEVLGLSRSDVVAVRRAGLIHDIGRCGVPNSVWDAPRELADNEWEEVRLHPYRTERVFAASTLAAIAELGAYHHERLNGSGYHRGVGGLQLPVAARLLAAADVYQALTQPRAHRPAHDAKAAAVQLREHVRDGILDADSAEAVLTAAGHRTARRAREWPGGLTSREVEVLRLLARGRTTKAIAAELRISSKTASHHIEHIYTKIGVSTRGAAALWAAEHLLV